MSETPKNTVYVTTSDGCLGDIVVDGDVAIWTVDWTGEEEDDPKTISEGLAGQPAGLIDAVIEEYDGGGITVPRPEPGADRPWALATFVDETFASEGAYSSDGVTVIYHDWSLRFADLAIGCWDKEEALENIESYRRDAELLGPNGKAAALSIIDEFAKDVERLL